jgi:hypothetical protein
MLARSASASARRRLHIAIDLVFLTLGVASADSGKNLMDRNATTWIGIHSLQNRNDLVFQPAIDLLVTIAQRLYPARITSSPDAYAPEATSLST